MAEFGSRVASSEELYKMRHSCAHVLAQAVLEMFPEAKLAIGPPIDNGFYYDFELPRTLIPEDLKLLEKKMKKIASQRQNFVESKQSITDAVKFLEEIKQPYKVELVKDLADAGEETVTFYENIQPQNNKGMFVDLCKGPHAENTAEIGSFKLAKIAGAYWKGDEKNIMLQRIYGYCFPNDEELQEFLNNLAEAEKRDHRRLGKDLNLFTFSPLVGAGLPLWKPNGAIVRDILQDYLKKEQYRRGYQPVISPHIGKKELYETSGHWQNYRDSMFSQILVDEEEYVLKAMNCPHHTQIYKDNIHSYRDLPVRFAEFGTVYRYEQTGELNGLTRVRGFTQDDAHIFCRPDQVEAEFLNVVDLVLEIFDKLGFSKYRARIGVRDASKDKYIGSDEVWSKAEASIKHACDKKGLAYTVEEGDAAFYGPKLDFVVEDVLGREWQLGTVQVDYNLPERFELEYIGEDGSRHRPIMIHRAPFGSMERFIGILIEHYAGAFPVWLAPEQLQILPIAGAHLDYAEEVYQQLLSQNIRCTLKSPTDSLGKRIRNAELQKVPYMIVIGDQEVAAKSVTVRDYATKEQLTKNLDEFIQSLVAESKV